MYQKYETMEKLDTFSKILLATGQINIVANTLAGVINDYKKLPKTEITQYAINEHEKELEIVLKQLTKTLEKVSDYTNGQDMVCAIDQRISKAPNEILLLGMDEVENDYCDDDETLF